MSPDTPAQERDAVGPDEAAVSSGLHGLRIGFIGSGRLATALAMALSRLPVHVAAVTGRNRDSATALSRTLPRCEVMNPQALVDHCDVVFVTTPDEAISPTVSALTWRSGKSVVHCSGATELSALDSARAEGARVGGFHPMQSFTDPAAAARSLPGCTISIEATGTLAQTLTALASALGCRVNVLPPGVRARYHAAAGFPSQFINVLLHEAAKIWASWGGSEEEALSAFIPMVRGTLMSIEARGLADGMPGPVSRGDAKTVAAHVDALRALDPEILDLYTKLCARSLDLAILRRDGLDADAQQRVRAALAVRQA